MTHNIKKENIFDFLKAEGIVEEISNEGLIEIYEDKNIGTTKLSIVRVESLSNSSKYWLLNPENGTFIESKTKKVEKVILEYKEDASLSIILVEMKSKTIIESEIVDKFEKSLSWIYLLLNLLSDKENQNIRVYGILVAQIDKNWDTRSNLNIFSSTSIRYIKRSFYTQNSEVNISLSNITEEIE